MTGPSCDQSSQPIVRPSARSLSPTSRALPEDVRRKALLWCDRHCCLCKKSCGINIEVHHIVPAADGGPDDLDNAIALCFDCHSDVGHYNVNQPRGTKYKSAELKARREQVYEEFTRHLVPPVRCKVTQALEDGSSRKLPHVGFTLHHLGNSLPVGVRVAVSVIQPEPALIEAPYYSGQRLWRLNPQTGISGPFDLPQSCTPSAPRLEVEVQVSVVDQFEREHAHLPIGFVFMPEANDWYLEP